MKRPMDSVHGRQPRSGMKLTVLALFLVACSALAEVQLPASGTQETLRSREGAPDAIRLDTEGQQLWEYSENRRRPAMEVQFDRQGQVAGARWLRGEADVLRALAERPARRDALALLGQPSAVEISASGVIWRYRSARGAGLVVQFGDDGRVQSITAAR